MNTKRNLFAALLTLGAVATFAQDQNPEITKDLKPFNSVITSPKVNVILQKGDKESVRITYHDVTADKINVQVKNHTLRIYLTDAKVTEKMVPDVKGRVGMYRYA